MKKKLLGLLGAGVILAGAAVMVEIRGVSGDLVPIFAFRWTPTAEERVGALPEDTNSTLQEGVLEGAGDWLGFLGAGRYPVVKGMGFSLDWDEEGPREVWRIKVGPGWAGFAVKGGRAVTQEQREEFEAVVCYELATGRLLWSHKDKARYDRLAAGVPAEIAGIGPRATPMIDGERVYTNGATGILNCLDLKTGKLIWQRNYVKEDGGAAKKWGNAGSPLVVDDIVVMNVGNGEGGKSLVAYGKNDGKLIWGAGKDETSYSSPMVAKVAGVRQILMFNLTSVTGHDVKTGRVLWRVGWRERKLTPRVAQPLVLSRDRLFFSSGYGAGCAMVRIEKDKDGGLKAEEIYVNRGFRAKFSNFVEKDGYLYGLDDGVMCCFDLAKGERVWREGRFGHGQLVLVGEVMLVLTEWGLVKAVKATAEGFEVVGAFEAFDGKAWNSPTLAGRYLLLRNDQEAVLYDLKGGK